MFSLCILLFLATNNHAAIQNGKINGYIPNARMFDERRSQDGAETAGQRQERMRPTQYAEALLPSVDSDVDEFRNGMIGKWIKELQTSPNTPTLQEQNLQKNPFLYPTSSAPDGTNSTL